MPQKNPQPPNISSNSLVLSTPGGKPIALSEQKLQAYLDASNHALNPREPSAGGLIDANKVIEFLKSPAGRDLLADWHDQLIELAEAKDTQEFFAREAQKRKHNLFGLLLLALLAEKEAAAEDLAKAIERQAEEARKQQEADEKHEAEEAAKVDYEPDEYDPLIRAAEDSIAEKELALDPVNQELKQLEEEQAKQKSAHQQLRQLKAEPAPATQAVAKQMQDIQTRIKEHQKNYPDLETRLTRLRTQIEKIQQEIFTLTAKKDVLVNSRNEALQRRQEENNQRRLATSTSPSLTTSPNNSNPITPTGNQQQSAATKPRPSGEAISSSTAPNTAPNPLTTRPAPTPAQTPQSRPSTQNTLTPTNRPPRAAELSPPASSNPQQQMQQQIRKELANMNAASKSKTPIEPPANKTPNNEVDPHSSPSPLKINPKQGS